MRRTVKSRSLGRRLAAFLFTTVSGLALVAGDFIIRNPVMTGGATAFLVIFGFVTANALWYQPQAHDNVFFKTRPELVFRATPRVVLPGQLEHSVQIIQSEQPVVVTETPAPEPSVDSADMLTALAPEADIEVARLQQKLSALGLYAGVVDGLPGPQTRQALEIWQEVQAKASTDKVDDIGKIIQVAVPVSRPLRSANRNIDNTTTAVVRPSPQRQPTPKIPVQTQSVISSQDIVRVQAGLKAFGNDLIVVDGVAGKSTQDAIREFQKLFGLQVSGQVDPGLIGKMREIGLIS